jgi:membrane fusion protein (multidrug efflux system)
MKLSQILCIVVALASLSLPACNPISAAEHNQHPEEHEQKVVATSPAVQDVTVTQKFVCQIRSRTNSPISALGEGGYLEEVLVKEGQAVKKGDVMFKILPTLYKAKLAVEQAEAKLADLQYKNSKRLYDEGNYVALQEVAIKAAELEKAQAKAKLASAEVDFTEIKAPFDGIVDRQMFQKGSLVKEGDVLTTLSDNAVMWVRFNVPETHYLDDMASRPRSDNGTRLELADTGIELALANGSKFKHDAGKTVTVEGQCDPETGNIQYRADFPNPEGLLRNGQTGNVLIHRTLANALVIPKRATFEILDKRYVYVLDDDNTVHQRLIQTALEMDDIFVVKTGIGAGDKILLEGVRLVREGQEVECDFIPPEKALANLKYHAE